MSAARRADTSRDDAVGAPLRHVIVVGGDASQWAALSASAWQDRVAELGKVADHAGASWLTVRPVRQGYGTDGLPTRTDTEVGSCVVSVQPVADGRERIAAAVAELQAAGAGITEQSIAAQLNSPAQADPDLVVVLGPSNHLPPSLVWELAYSELVFLDADWANLSGAHLEAAIAEFAHRHRRFGGID
ncbi:MAG: undecaprenyl diphosphate synthase family protein [Actinomycetota bacterium]